MLQHDTDASFSKLVADQNARGQRNRFPGDENLIVVFKEDAVPDMVATESSGYPKYRPADVITIWTPGDRFNKIEREATEQDKLRFKQRYDEFKSGQKPSETGCPLEMWPAINKALVMELKYHNIHTVEQLAALSDGNAQQVGPINELKRKALDYLKTAKDSEHINKMRAEISKRDLELETLQKVVEAQGKKIEELSRAKR